MTAGRWIGAGARLHHGEDQQPRGAPATMAAGDISTRSAPRAGAAAWPPGSEARGPDQCGPCFRWPGQQQTQSTGEAAEGRSCMAAGRIGDGGALDRSRGTSPPRRAPARPPRGRSCMEPMAVTTPRISSAEGCSCMALMASSAGAVSMTAPEAATGRGWPDDQPHPRKAARGGDQSAEGISRTGSGPDR